MSFDDDMTTDEPEVSAVLVYAATPPGLNHVFGALGRFVFAVRMSPDWEGPIPVVGDVVEVTKDSTSGTYVGTKVIGHRNEDPSLTSSYLDLPLEFGQADARFQDAPSVAYTSQLARPASWALSSDGTSEVIFGRRGAAEVRSWVYYGRSLSWWRLSFGSLEPPPYSKITLLPERPQTAGVVLTLTEAFEPGDPTGPVPGLDPVGVDLIYRGPTATTTVELPDAWLAAMADGKGGCIQFEQAEVQPGTTTIAVGELGSLAIH